MTRKLIGLVTFYSIIFKFLKRDTHIQFWTLTVRDSYSSEGLKNLSYSNHSTIFYHSIGTSLGKVFLLQEVSMFSIQQAGVKGNLLVGYSLIDGQPIQVVRRLFPSDVYLKAPLNFRDRLSGLSPLSPDEAFAETLFDSTMMRLNSRLLSFDPETLQDLDKVNQRLAQEGRPPVDIVAVTKEIEAITNDPHLSDKEKRAKINDVRKRLGLEKGEMKKLFTKRLEKIYGELKNDLERTLQSLQSDVQRAEKAHGKDSPQALAAAARLDVVARVNQPLLQKLDQNQKLYNSMYKPGGCIKKVFKGIGNVFKGVLKTPFNGLGILNPKNWLRPTFWRDIVAPLALHFIPGLGPLVATAYRYGMAAYQGFKAISALTQGKFREAFSLGLGALKGFSTRAYNAVTGFVQKIKERGLAWINF